MVLLIKKKKLSRCLENYTAEPLQFYSSIGEDLF